MLSDLPFFTKTLDLKPYDGTFNPGFSNRGLVTWSHSPRITGLAKGGYSFPNLEIIRSYGLTGLPRWLSGKDLPANAGEVGSIPELGRSPGGGNGNPSFLAWEIPSMELQRVGHD